MSNLFLTIFHDNERVLTIYRYFQRTFTFIYLYALLNKIQRYNEIIFLMPREFRYDEIESCRYVDAIITIFITFEAFLCSKILS